jgi:rRNA-processing protein FCF1
MRGKKGAQPVIIDTNAMILQIEYKINFESELVGLLGSYEIFIPITVLNELSHIKDKHARAALKLAQKYQNVESVKTGDDAIVSLALKLNAIVITNDRELRKRLLALGKSVIYVRQRAYLAMEVP